MLVKCSTSQIGSATNSPTKASYFTFRRYLSSFRIRYSFRLFLFWRIFVVLIIATNLQALCPSMREVRRGHVATEQTVLEMTGTDRPGIMSEMSAVLLELGCSVTSAVAWTHNTRAACIIYLEDGIKGGPISDPIRLAHVEEQLENVVEAHHGKGERRSVRLAAPVAGQTHTERRLHQLMFADRDYERCHGCDGTHVSIESCKEKGYSVVNVRSRDRPKLLFDTVCVLTDMQYVVFHAAVASKASMADQVRITNILQWHLP